MESLAPMVAMFHVAERQHTQCFQLWLRCDIHTDHTEVRAMDQYPPIADHGLIGDLQTAALVTTDGAIDWYCCPRFDSPSVFAALLDHDHGGSFRIAPAGHDYVTKQLYFPDSAVLITRFMASDGVGEVIDFMPIDHPKTATAHHELVRRVRVVRGSMRFSLDCMPRFDYGRQPARACDGRAWRGLLHP